MGPLALPEPSRKRRWGWLALWTLLVFAGGVAAGPTLIAQALVLVERAYSMLGMSPPKFGEKVEPVALAPTHVPAAPSIVPLPSPSPGAEEAATGEERAAAPAAVPEPVAPQPAARAEAMAAPGRPPAAEMPVARASHTKIEARASSSKAAPAKSTASPPAAAPAPGGFHDPFADGTEPTSEPRAATASRKSKPSVDEPAAAAKSEPAPKPAASTSHDPLDNLMADVVTDNKGKGKQREGKGLDALLKDVQKSEAPPAPKSEAPPAPASLSQADISRVMAGVKTRGKDCARQLGQNGIAELKLAVGKDGRVTDVSVGGKLANTPLAACIEKAARAASFPPSPGLRFDYRIDVR